MFDHHLNFTRAFDICMVLTGFRSLYALPGTLTFLEVSTNVALFSRVQYDYDYAWCDLCISHCEADCLAINPINKSDIILSIRKNTHYPPSYGLLVQSITRGSNTSTPHTSFHKSAGTFARLLLIGMYRDWRRSALPPSETPRRCQTWSRGSRLKPRAVGLLSEPHTRGDTP